LFGDRWTPFFVSNSLVQDQPDQATLSMRNGSDGLCVPKTRYHAVIPKSGVKFSVSVQISLKIELFSQNFCSSR
jgi:hypothetical protein